MESYRSGNCFIFRYVDREVNSRNTPFTLPTGVVLWVATPLCQHIALIEVNEKALFFQVCLNLV